MFQKLTYKKGYLSVNGKSQDQGAVMYFSCIGRLNLDRFYENAV